jgi:hypothetical protein
MAVRWTNSWPAPSSIGSVSDGVLSRGERPRAGSQQPVGGSDCQASCDLPWLLARVPALA